MADPIASPPTPPPASPGPADAPPAAPASASPASPPSGTPSAGPEGTPPAAPPAPPAEDWKEARIRKLTAQLHEARQAPRAPDPNAPPPPNDGRVSLEDARAYARQEALNLATAMRFNEDCERAAGEGRKQFKDFDDKVKELTKVVTPGDPESMGRYNTLLMAALKTGNAARVIHQLGSDLGTAQRLMELDPMSVTAELTRMALNAGGAPPEVSNAPRPLNIPTGSGGAPLGDLRPDDPQAADRLDSAEWHRRRNEQVTKRASPRGASFR